MSPEPTLTRRALLVGGGAAALAIGVAPGSLVGRLGERRVSRGRVIVVGAGLAGLTAAYELEARGWETTVLEARDRLGGRVHTIRFPGGQHAEAGGEFVDTHHRQVRKLCDRFGLELVDAWRGSSGQGVVYRGQTRWLARNFRDPAIRRRIDAAYRRLDALALPLKPSDPGANGGRALDRRSVADFCDRIGLEGRARFLFDRSIRDDYGDDPRNVSLLLVALGERIAWDQPSAGVEAFRIEAGSSALAEALAARLREPPRLARPVARIAQGSQGVEVETATGEIHQGDHCVVALPLPLLPTVEFSPALPEATARAAAELRNSPVTKVLLGYRRRFWTNRGLSGDLASSLPINTSWEATNAQAGRSGVLITYAAGVRGKAMAGLRERRRVSLARRDLDRVFPGSAALLAEAASAPWPAEPYSRGAWATYGPGQVLPNWPVVHEGTAIGRLQLAGEYTERLAGYMEGAIRSGQAAARRLSG